MWLLLHTAGTTWNDSSPNADVTEYFTGSADSAGTDLTYDFNELTYFGMKKTSQSEIYIEIELQARDTIPLRIWDGGIQRTGTYRYQYVFYEECDVTYNWEEDTWTFPEEGLIVNYPNYGWSDDDTELRSDWVTTYKNLYGSFTVYASEEIDDYLKISYWESTSSIGYYIYEVSLPATVAGETYSLDQNSIMFDPLDEDCVRTNIIVDFDGNGADSGYMETQYIPEGDDFTIPRL